MALTAVTAAATTMTACVEDPGPGTDSDEALVLSHEFPTLQAAAGEERNYICQSWTLGNDEPLYVNAAMMVGGPGWHHSNWLFAPETDFAGPDDTWNCEDRGFELVKAGIAGGVLMTQSPEVESETEQFAPSVTIVIPARSKIIAEVHLLNASDSPLVTHAHLELHTLPAARADVLLAPLALSYYPLELPASSRSEFTADCDLATIYGADLDFRVYHVAAHYHALGEGMSIESYDHDGNGDMIYETSSPIGEPLGYTLPVPFDLSGSQGIRFACRYDNYTPNVVGYGSQASGEMCVMFAFTDSTVRFIGGVPQGGTSVAVAGGDPDMHRFTSGCSVLALQQSSY